MRKKGIVFLLVIFALIVAILLIFTDRWLENQMEAAGTSLVGARVEFDGVDFSLLKLHLKWNRLQVTDPNNTWKNVFETGLTEFDLDLLPLLSKKVIIENIELEGLRFYTDRTTDGKVTREAEAPEEKSKAVEVIEEKFRREAAHMPVFNLQQYARKVNVDSIWKMIDLKAPAKIDSLKKVYEGKYQDWQKRISDLPDQNDYTRITRELESLKPDQIRTVEEFQQARAQATGIYQRVDSMKNEVTRLKSNFEGDISGLKQNQSSLNDWVKQDYQRALQVARLPDISVKNMARLLFGDRIINQIQRVLGYVGTARYYSEKMKSTSPKKESPPRLKGQDIHFAAVQVLPKFWIKNIALSGETNNQMQLSGKVRNIVSRQTLIGLPTTINIQGKRKDQASLDLMATLDYREEIPREDIQLNIREMPLANVKLSDFALLPSKIQQGRGEISADLEFRGGDFQSQISFRGSNLQYDFSEKPANLDARLVEVSRSLQSSLNVITFVARAKEQNNDFSFNMDSNIDELVAAKLKSLVSDEIQKARQQIEGRVQQEIEKYRQDLENLIRQKEQELRAQIARIEEQIEKQQNMIKIKQKEIEDQLKAAGKQELQNNLDEGKKKIKDLFKK